MRIIGSLLGVLSWRFRLGLAGLRLRFRGLLSALMVLGGVGGALGYAVAKRMLEDPDESTSQQDR